jgi:hypothetical protein
VALGEGLTDGEEGVAVGDCDLVGGGVGDFVVLRGAGDVGLLDDGWVPTLGAVPMVGCDPSPPAVGALDVPCPLPVLEMAGCG